MIKTRLVQLLSHAKKYVAYNVIWKWLSLLCQVALVYAASMLLEHALYHTVTQNHVLFYGVTVLIAVVLRFFCDRQASYASYKASVDVKRILRKRIYGKLLKLGASYRENVKTSEVVQVAAEGVEQLEIYTELGDSFLENLQGLTTLKIYQADEKKAREMEQFCTFGFAGAGGKDNCAFPGANGHPSPGGTVFLWGGPQNCHAGERIV